MDKFSKKIILAPMAGITDLPNRIICKELGADILHSEMVSATGLKTNKANNLHYVNSCRQDHPLVVQLFGADCRDFVKALNIIDTLPKRDELAADEFAPRRPEGIDINFGCPVKKVMKQGAGCALMGELERSRAIVKAVVENTALDVSIKIRAGFNGVTALHFVENIADLGWSTMTVHGRTYAQGFSGEIDHQLIGELKTRFPGKIVIANGGIYSPEQAKAVLDVTAADGLAIARGALGNPWIFGQIKSFLAGNSYQPPASAEISQVAKRHLELFCMAKGEHKLREMRKHLGWYVRGLPAAKSLRNEIYSISSKKEALEVIAKI